MLSQLCAEHNIALQVLAIEKFYMPDLSVQVVHDWREASQSLTNLDRKLDRQKYRRL